MRRYFFEISYDGSAFFGWQIQPNEPSVQETIERALTKLNGNKAVSIVGCGRTDTGVHAHSYVFHVDFLQEIDTEQWVYKLNKMLPTTIAAKNCWEISTDIHARFSAVKRTYRYYIHFEKDPFKHAFSTYIPQELAIHQMNEASKCLLGIHDFTTFSKTNTDVKTHLCEVFEACWKQDEKGWYFEYSANRFLRNMVRATVGTLFAVGSGKISIEKFQQIFNSTDRSQCLGSAAPQGLHLWSVEYP